MIVIDYSTALRALDDYVKTYNEGCTSLKDRIRQGTNATAKEMIRLYGGQLILANNRAKVDRDDLPPLSTNNIHLSKVSNASSRTIQRHIKKLQEVGIITNKKFRGSKANYKVWINPKILLATQFISEKDAESELRMALSEAFEKESIKKGKTSTCPNREPSNNGYNNNILIDVCNSNEKTEFDRFLEESGHNWSGHTGKKLDDFLEDWDKFEAEELKKSDARSGDREKKKVALKKKSENTGRKWQKREVKGPSTMVSDDENNSRSASLNLYIDLLWNLAKNTLYANHSLTSWQIDTAKNLIAKLYEPVKGSALSTVHEHYVARIAWQHESIKRQPERRFVLLPHQYFDTNNSHGFVGTKQPFLLQEAKKERLKKQLITSQAIRRYNENLKKPVERQKPILDLYRTCETRVSKLGNKELLTQFHSAVLEPNIHQLLYAN